MNKIDMIGKRYGRLTVISQSESITPGRLLWLCKCDCGNECVVRGISLRRGDRKSCGCLSRESARQRASEHVTHGQSKTRLYKIWFNMRARCNKASHPDYHRYGARGIKVCEEWNGSFQPFYDWSMANGYQDDLTIDRIDNNSNYTPHNCRWVNSKVQNNNTRRNHYVTHGGETLTIKQWSRKQGINHNTLYSRLVKYGWSVERALTEGASK